MNQQQQYYQNQIARAQSFLDRTNEQLQAAESQSRLKAGGVNYQQASRNESFMSHNTSSFAEQNESMQ